MVPMEYEFSRSNTGVHVVPAFVVFHTPPAATPTYHVFLSRGLTAMSLMRPESIAGPIGRSLTPASGPPPPRSPLVESPGCPPDGPAPDVPAVSCPAARRFRVVSDPSARARPESDGAPRGAGAGWRRGCCAWATAPAARSRIESGRNMERGAEGGVGARCRRATCDARSKNMRRVGMIPRVQQGGAIMGRGGG